MRLIVKGQAPRRLVADRSARVAFADLSADTKQDMRKALVAEQLGLCCFCMTPIRADAEVMRLAHLVPQSTPKGRARALDWNNVFAACSGGERPGESSPRETLHCDVRQADAILVVDPSNPWSMTTLVYRHPPPATTGGALALHSGYEISSTDAAITHDLNENLNLNTPWLCSDRAEALHTLLDQMSAKGRITEQRLEHALARFETAGIGANLPPFAGFVAWWLRKRLGRR